MDIHGANACAAEPSRYFLDRVAAEVIPRIHASTVVLGRRLEDQHKSASGIARFKGSGVLIRLDDHGPFGILTAAHVVEALRPRRGHPERFVAVLRNATVDARATMRLPPATFDIPHQAMTACGRRNRQAHGPDIAWIPLSSPQSAGIRDHAISNGSFYNMALANRSVGDVVQAWRSGTTSSLTDVGVSYILGWSAEIQSPRVNDSLKLPAFQGLLEHKWTERGWIYADYQIGAKNRAPASDARIPHQLRVGYDTPAHLGGVSGGGVWHIEAHPTNDRLVHHLEGIVYYDYRTRERRYLRAHDSLSFHRILSDAGVHGTRRLSDDRWTTLFATFPN